jgi:hypothetical protein
MTEIEKIRFAMERFYSKSVKVYNKQDWLSSIAHSGRPTKFINIPEPYEAIQHDFSYIESAGSGVVNPSPGIDIVRFDPKDEPYIYNTDHYNVIEDFIQKPEYQNILRIAGLIQTLEVDNIVREYVFIIGPEKLNCHWAEEVPGHIANAKVKGEDEE